MLGMPTGQSDQPDSKNQQKTDDKALVEHCRKLYSIATEKQPKDRLKTCAQYYLGRYKNGDSQGNGVQGSASTKDSYNIINPIVETKTSLTLDSEITTSVNAVIGAMADLNALTQIQAISDVMNDILDHIKRVNKFEQFGRESIRSVEMFGIMIGRVSWDQDQLQGIGEVKIDLIDPKNFFPDPAARTIAECNYVILKNRYSAITLKRRYPDRIEDIDKLMKTQAEKSGSDMMDQSNNVVTYKNDVSAAQVYISNNPNLVSMSESVEVLECYLRDDSTFIPGQGDSGAEIAEKERIGFRYPYGRVIIFAGDNLIFEDKPIEIPTGIPIVTANLYPTDDIWGQGDVEKLIPVQDRINRAYRRIQLLVGGYISTILIDELAGITSENEFVNKLITIVETGVLPARQPIILTNNTLSEIRNLTDLVAQLKAEAKEIGRVNDMMISGQSKENVSSAKMVDSLNESPMTSIREIQAVYYQYLVDISNYAIMVAQQFYNIPRIIRMTNGKDFLSFTPPQDGQEGNIQQLQLQKGEGPDQTLKVVKEIKGDLSLTEFECEVSTGRNLPRSRGAIAALTMDLY
jgi:hypothetical protein